MAKYNDMTPEELDNLTMKECEEILTPKHILFAKNYIINFNGRRSVIEAGYPEASAHSKATVLKNHPVIVKYIEHLMSNRMNRLEVTGDKVVAEMAKIGFFNIKDIYDEGGNIIPIQQMPPHVAAGISKIKEKVLSIGEDNERILEREYQFHNKAEALRDLGKHTGIFEKDNKQKQATVHAYIPDNNRDKKK